MTLKWALQIAIEKRTRNAHLSHVVNAQGSDYSARAFANAGGVLSRPIVKTHRAFIGIVRGISSNSRAGGGTATSVRSGS
jgi:hypothetical protein